MSDETKTTEAEAAVEGAEITTLNSHATSEPLSATILKADDEDTTVTPDNSHATDEKA
ncbi:hypothetical protein ACWCYL_10235 [Streptomyces sp. 900105755]|uniref:hypothetical protein n=1 Tax=Streptomyces sp. 900105755 TaxID=3154389 RepID=UPI0033169AEA